MKRTIEEMREAAIAGYTDYSGIELLDMGDGYAEGRVRIEDYHLNPYGAVHGGLIFCLGDVMGGIACSTLGAKPVTVNSNVSYFSPLIGTKEITARAQVVKYGRTMMFTEISIFNDQHVEACRMNASYYNVRERKH